MRDSRSGCRSAARSWAVKDEGNRTGLLLRQAVCGSSWTASGMKPGPDDGLLRGVARGDEGAPAVLYDARAGWPTVRMPQRCAMPDVIGHAVQGAFLARWKEAASPVRASMSAEDSVREPTATGSPPAANAHGGGDRDCAAVSTSIPHPRSPGVPTALGGYARTAAGPSAQPVITASGRSPGHPS
jgi:hypothetical protein